jgi:hypothetical protein
MTTHTSSSAPVQNPWEALAEDFDRHVTPQNVQLAEQALRFVEPLEGARFLDVAAGSARPVPACWRSTSHRR